ncbi:MAG: iron permease [Chloroflexi bacterium]|nr:iron permease [Chloroflexota bacterium]
MLPAFLLSLREGIEIALIIGIVLGALRKLGRQELTRAVWAGALSAGIVSLAIAFVLQRLDATLVPPTEQIFEGTMMFLAAGVLTWMIFWMQRQARYMKGAIEGEVRLVTAQNGQRGLFLLAFISVLREGIELALIITAAALAVGDSPAAWGALIGLVAAAALGWVIFTAAIHLNLRVFFQVTSVLLILFAAGLVAHGMHEFNEISLIPSIIAPVWNTSRWLTAESTLGLTLKTLFGYNPNPSLTEILAYLSYFGLIFLGIRLSQSSIPAEQKI